MIPSLKEYVTIKAGGLIEIRNPNLPEGSTAEVIVLLNPMQPESSDKPLSRFFGRIQGCFADGPQADDFLRAERDAWES